MAKQEYEEKYTHPELRERIKEEIKASDKGGKEGQWSARKSQLLTQEYEKQGGALFQAVSGQQFSDQPNYAPQSGGRSKYATTGAWSLSGYFTSTANAADSSCRSSLWISEPL